MAPAIEAAHEASARTSAPAPQNRPQDQATAPKPPRRTLDSLLRNATDDEILGLSPRSKNISRANELASVEPAGHEYPRDRIASSSSEDVDSSPLSPEGESSAPAAEGNREADSSIPQEVRAALYSNPELRSAWQDAQAYRETFATPEEARAAVPLLADLNRMDALFFSRRPEDHAELARSIAQLDPTAFASLAQAIARQSAGAADNPALTLGARQWQTLPAADARQSQSHQLQVPVGQNLSSPPQGPGPSAAQTDFFHATNAAAVEGVLAAIESQVERLLPENASKSARGRVVGEIYRELDTTLRSNRQLTQQMREAFRSGSLDADHQRAIVSLVTGRARQALPAVAKRVLNEWTSTIVAANQDRRARQRTAERRIDIAGSGGSAGESRRITSPRDINYSRMSDADILNL
jgi:hypothetical protein